jgi:hypothetical protein
MKRFHIPIFMASALFWGNQSHAADCSDYPLSRGIDVSAVEGSEIPKIISTSVTTPFSTDVDDVNDAYDEAEILAKTGIAKYMAELASSEQLIQSEAIKIAKTSGENRETQSQKTKVILKTISSKASEILTGVLVLGDCYTPGKEVRVSVGLKPETVALATGLSSGITKSMAERNVTSQLGNQDVTNNSEEKSSDASGLRETEGSSNTELLKKF